MLLDKNHFQRGKCPPECPLLINFANCLGADIMCRLPIITFANSLDPDQARQNVGHDLDINCLTLIDGIPGRIFRKSVNFEKSQQATIKP